MKQENITSKSSVYLLLIIISLLSLVKSGFAGNYELSLKESGIKNLSTPPLGITSSSTILLWDDAYIPDYTDASSGRTKKIQ